MSNMARNETKNDDIVNANKSQEDKDREKENRLKAPVVMTRLVVTRIPTAQGECKVYLYHSSRHPEKEHMAFVYGDLSTKRDPLVRVHSECFTGEVIGSLRCDCLEQLRRAQEMITDVGVGVIVYLRQEGRGIGLLEKLKAYNLQDEGFDTVDANLELGHGEDERTYDEAARILEDLGVKAVKLLTNNTKKVQELNDHGIRILGRIPVIPRLLTQENLSYLQTKIFRMQHVLDIGSMSLGGSNERDFYRKGNWADEGDRYDEEDSKRRTKKQLGLNSRDQNNIGQTVPHNYFN